MIETDLLACPVDHRPLAPQSGGLICDAGHQFLVVDGVPILLHPDHAPVIPSPSAPLERLAALAPHGDGEVDSFVQETISATNGMMYEPLIGKLSSYPIPRIRLPRGRGERLLDIGCNWGRWVIAAARNGYRAVGMDPNAEAVLAARRVARQLGVEADFVVGDARYLPFRVGAFDVVYSYSVLQHLPKKEVRRSVAGVSRVLRPGGYCKIEMPNTFGARCFYHQARRGFREPRELEVRYWKPRELTRLFDRKVGSASLSVDGFFSLNPQTTDIDLLPWKYRTAVRASSALRGAAKVFPPLKYAADSLFVSARKN